MKSLLSLLVLVSLPLLSRACDVCGCSVGGPYFGILPQHHRYVLGLRGYASRFDNTHPDEVFITHDRFRSLELWGRAYPLPRLQLLGTLPYHFLESQENEQVERADGIGDATVLATYSLIHDVRCGAWRHQWQLGGGVKAPTGKYYRDRTDQPGLQLGTGTWDLLASSTYTIRHNRWGANADATYRFNGEAANGYRFGNRLTTGARLFYWKEWKSGVALLPNAGLLWEQAEKDHHGRQLLPYTGGNCLLATLGVDLYFNHLTIGATLKTPLSQRLAEGYAQSGERVVVNLAWMF